MSNAPIFDPRIALSGPSVPGVLDLPSTSFARALPPNLRATPPTLTTASGRPIVLPPDLAAALTESSALFDPAALTQNPLLARLPRATPPARLPLQDLFQPTGQPIIRNLQRNQTTLLNKYREMAPVLRQLPPGVVAQLQQMDSERVVRGASPLTREETVNLAQTLTTGKPTTPEADRGFSLGDIWEGAKSNIADITRSILHMPAALAREGAELPDAPEVFRAARERGESPLRALFGSTPGARIIPGAFVLSNLETPGELARNPIFTLLDISPYARGAAGLTPVGRAARARSAASLAEISAFTPPARYRPIRSLLTERLSDVGELIPNRLGTRTGTPSVPGTLEATPGFSAIARAFGPRARAASRGFAEADQRIVTIMLNKGYDIAKLPIERVAARLAKFRFDWEHLYPELTATSRRPSAARELATARTALTELLETDPSRLDPGFVSAWRDLQIEVARAVGVKEGALGEINVPRQTISTPDGPVELPARSDFYPIDQAREILKREDVASAADMMLELNQHMLTPSRVTAGQLRSWRARANSFRSPRLRKNANLAIDHTMDAYGTSDALLAPSVPDSTLFTPPATRLSLPEMLVQLKSIKPADRQAIFAESAVTHGLRTELAQRLRNLQARRVPPEVVTPDLVASLRSYAERRAFFDARTRKFTAKTAARAHQTHLNYIARTPPARFSRLLTREFETRMTTALTEQLSLAHPLSAADHSNILTHVLGKVWRDIPGLDNEWLQATAANIKNEVVKSYQTLLARGLDPAYVHHVSPHRAAQTLAPHVGPVPPRITQHAERGQIDLTPRIDDISVSLTHQGVEFLEREYSITKGEELIRAMGRPVDELRSEYLHYLTGTRGADRLPPSMDLATRVDKAVNNAWELFNPDTHGFSWGGERLAHLVNEGYMIPKAVAQNLHRMATRDRFFSEFSMPLTKAFRYNVIGLSPTVTINNFISNQIAANLELGPGYLRQWGRARRLIKALKSNDPSVVAESLRETLLAEQPHMEGFTRDQWMTVRAQHQSGTNAYWAFQHSAVATGIKRFGSNVKAVGDFVVSKNLAAQRWGDNVTRTAIFLAEMEKWGKQSARGRGPLAGLTRAQAEAYAMEMVHRVIVDYRAFTPIERNAIRQIVPFYGFMSHAARFVTRYPADHPMRVAVMAGLARAQKDRLGALPGNFLSMYPIPFLGGYEGDETGHAGFFNMRMFNPFGETGDLFSLSGWAAAANPLAQVVLQQFGITRGEQDIYPTLRYDPDTGRMRPVKPSIFGSLLFTSVPRFATIASALGLNPDYNQLRARDPSAARRSLLGQAGVPRLYRDIDVYEEIARAEIAREQAANDVLNDALRSGNYAELMRYPSLRPYLAQVLSLTPQQRAALTPPDPTALQGELARISGAG